MTNLSIVPSHKAAEWMVSTIDRFLDSVGLAHYQTLEEVIYFAIIVTVAILIGWAVRRVILYALQRFTASRDTVFCRELLKQHTLTRCSHVITPLVLLGLVPFAFEDSTWLHTMVIRAALVYTTAMFGVAVVAIAKFVFTQFNIRENSKGLPINGILNIAIGIVWAIVLIICVSIVVDKSPTALLGGLTAFAAVLMLVFKDTILGFVAGIQMSQNDMLRAGDWIVVPSTIANGVVEDVTLTTVKVRNFDNTLVMVPPYTLVSTCFQNWRGMSESGARRICENIYINPATITRPGDKLLDALCGKYTAVKDFADKLRAAGTMAVNTAGNAPVNGTLETNLGLFRAYMVSYLLANNDIDNTLDLMVNVGSPSHEGVPLQIYCFTTTTQWEQYTGIKSTVLEHAIHVSGDFGLEILCADNVNLTEVKEDTEGQTK